MKMNMQTKMTLMMIFDDDFDSDGDDVSFELVSQCVLCSLLQPAVPSMGSCRITMRIVITSYCHYCHDCHFSHPTDVHCDCCRRCC